jgi:hypothetical protein
MFRGLIQVIVSDDVIVPLNPISIYNMMSIHFFTFVIFYNIPIAFKSFRWGNEKLR